MTTLGLNGLLILNWITRKGTGLKTSYILPCTKCQKITKEWADTKDSIWLPNFFEGKDPFDGRQVDEKGLPAGGIDKRGSTVLPKKNVKKEEPETEF